MPLSLSERAEAIIRQFPERAALKSVIEKELVHYDIFTFDKAEIVNSDNLK